MQGGIDTRWYALGESAKIVRLEGIEFRAYQFNITKNVNAGHNTLVILPTALGKTLIGIFAIANVLVKGKKALVLAPTKPLSEQHHISLLNLLDINKERILLLTGAISKKKRSAIENEARVIVATPQTISNDLKGGALSLDDFGVVVFDECHRAIGKYAYTYIADECVAKGVQMLGLTASPGSRKERIKALLDTLKIEEIEIRISSDPDVMPYVMPKYMRVMEVDKSKLMLGTTALLRPLIEDSLGKLNKMGLTNFKQFEHIPKGRLIEMGNMISRIQARNFKLGAMHQYSKLLNLLHAYDLLETEGLYSFSEYMKMLSEKEQKSRAIESLLNDRNVIAARQTVDTAMRNGEEHPKAFALLEILKSNGGKSVMVFAQFRTTIKMLVTLLTKNGLSARAFVGKKEGITQEQQKQTIADFRERKFDILVSTSIGEEGLDIPTVDLVVFYEPIPSEIRNIQRRGRTGRLYAGEVVLLVTKGTKDEIYLFVSMQRERKMLSIVNKLKGELSMKKQLDSGQQRL